MTYETSRAEAITKRLVFAIVLALVFVVGSCFVRGIMHALVAAIQYVTERALVS